MAQLIAQGLTGGHWATFGWWSEEFEEAILSMLEAQTGLAPLVRVKLDLDGDGSFEIIEMDKLDSVGNISRAIEYTTNKPSFGSSNIRLHNCDGRYTDNWSKSLTYFDPANPTRYHMRRVVIELGFDWIHKHEEAYWIPIFDGFIVEKTEDAETRTVSISLMDEWQKILNFNLAPEIPAKYFIQYTHTLDFSSQLGSFFLGETLTGSDSGATAIYINDDGTTLKFYYSGFGGSFVVGETIVGSILGGSAVIDSIAEIDDPRTITRGTYYGKHDVFRLFKQERDGHLLIPLITNSAGIGYRFGDDAVPANQLLTPLMLNKHSLKDYIEDTLLNTADDERIWFWLWDDTWTGQKEWAYLDSDKFAYTGAEDIYLVPDSGNLTFNGGAVTIALADYFDSTQENYDPLMGFAAVLEYNPVRILFDVLHNSNMMNIPLLDIDASNADPGLWADVDLDFDDENDYSWDTSASYLDKQSAKLCVDINEEANVGELIDDICAVTRGGFFIDKGREKSGEKAVRRIKFVIHEPRRQPPTVRALSEQRLHEPRLTRGTADVRNYINVTNFDFDTASNSMEDTKQYIHANNHSISVYGKKELSIGGKPGDKTFLYDSGGYCQFLSSHFLMLLKEPPMVLKFNTDLIGLNWDLKNLVAVVENQALFLDYNALSDLTGLFEVYNFNFNTQRFYIDYEARWAGYLIMPEGDINKRWAWADEAYADTHEGIDYWAW